MLSPCISSGLIKLEKEESTEERTVIIETAFREAHSLKGAARAVDRSNVQVLAQSLEKLFVRWKDGGVSPSAEGFGPIRQAIESIEKLLSTPHEVPERLISRLVEELDRARPDQWDCWCRRTRLWLAERCVIDPSLRTEVERYPSQFRRLGAGTPLILSKITESYGA